MSVGIGNEAEQFLFWEYINRIFDTVRRNGVREGGPVAILSFLSSVSCFLSRRPGVFDHWWRLEDDVKILQVLVLFVLQNVALLRPRPLNQQKINDSGIDNDG
jgi:hypothetical protein